MPALTKKRPPMEAEPGEGKAHEMRESPEEEVREGSEASEKKMYGKTNRKRRVRGSDNTKAPMDGEGCSCGGGKGRKKGTCDGSCGGYAKKMDSALTPQEYLSACDLGIQDLSRSYIRARLDMAERMDLKCGAGSISPGEKCSKGTAQGASSRSRRPSIRRGITTGAKYGALINGLAGAAQGATLGSMTGGGLKGALAGAAVSGAINTVSGAVVGGAIGGGVNAVRRHSYTARRRARGKQDAVWADGFEPMENRGDLKCGKGSISPGEKCTKGTAERITGNKTAEGQFRKIANNNEAAREFNTVKASTKGTGRKIMRAGEVAANLGAAAAAGVGGWNYASGLLSGDVSKVGQGLAAIQGAKAAVRISQASKARRMGSKKLANEFLKSAGRQAAAAGVAGGAAYAASRVQGRQQQTGARKPGRNKAVKDPFKDLGVNSRSSDAEIKTAWKKAMAQHHPDRGGDPEKAKSINAAYQEILRRRGRKDSIYADGFDINWAEIMA